MTVLIASKIIQKSDSLSELARQALTYIDGGPQWLAWALPNPSVYYEVPDETTLLARVQQGLHASPMTLLPQLGLLVSPVKLMTLGSANLHLLGQVETGDTSAAVLQQAQRILADNHLLTAQQLRSTDDFLKDVGVDRAPVFQALDVNDRAALVDLGAVPSGQEGQPQQLCREAAAFAIEQARTVPEFCDYYQIYLAHAKKMNALGGDAATRARLAYQAVQTLLPLAFGAMDCPQLPDRLPAPADVEQSLRNWLAKGYKIGFARLSQAVLQIVTQSIFTAETGSEAARLFELYLSAAQAFLTTNRITESRLGQDGSSLVFTLQSANEQAQLQVNADRLLSLRSFGTWTKPDPWDGLPHSLSTTSQPEPLP